MNVSTLLRTAALAVVLGSAFASTGSAASFTYNGTGGAVDDAIINGTPNATYFDIDLSGTPGTVSSITSVTLTNFNHAFAGDLGVYLLGSNYNDGTDTGAFATLFSPPSNSPVQFSGNYTFVVNSSFPTIDETVAGKDGTFIVPSGTYAIADFSTTSGPGPRGTYAPLVGEPLDGLFSLEIDDFNVGDAGTLGSWSFSGTSVVPEPTSIAALGLLGTLIRRRK